MGNRPPSVSNPEADIAPVRTSSTSRASFLASFADMPTLFFEWSQSTPMNSYLELAVRVSACFHVTFACVAKSSTIRVASRTSLRDPAYRMLSTQVCTVSVDGTACSCLTNSGCPATLDVNVCINSGAQFLPPFPPLYLLGAASHFAVRLRSFSMSPLTFAIVRSRTSSAAVSISRSILPRGTFSTHHPWCRRTSNKSSFPSRTNSAFAVQPAEPAATPKIHVLSLSKAPFSAAPPGAETLPATYSDCKSRTRPCGSAAAISDHSRTSLRLYRAGYPTCGPGPSPTSASVAPSDSLNTAITDSVTPTSQDPNIEAQNASILRTRKVTEEQKNNSQPRLSDELTGVTRNFSQMILDFKKEAFKQPTPPAPVPDDMEGKPADVLYLYKKWVLPGNMLLCARTYADGVLPAKGNELFRAFPLLLLGSKQALIGGQIGAIRANEIQNNCCRLVKQLAVTILAGAHHMKVGLVSRKRTDTRKAHMLHHVESVETRDQVQALSTHPKALWNILIRILTEIVKAKSGERNQKFVLMRDPGKPTLRLRSADLRGL
ncbi:Eukaryotic translation initiation factor 3 subunit D [Diplonema papillatum]|nr:Eukaryotic translation initiation factor 3 subunit D [Diplonema papillatum]